MKNRKNIIWAVAALAGLLVIWAMIEHFRFVTTDNAQLEAHTVMLAAKVPGYLVAVHVDEGQKVKKGDLLAEVDHRDYENTLRQVKGELTSVQARMRDAEKNYKRLSELYAKGVVSSQQFDTATAAFSDIKAKSDAVSAQLAQAQLNLDNTNILAPADGVVARRAAEPGQLASAGVPLFGFVGSAERWVIANFKETDITDVHIGAAAQVTVDALDGKTYRGSVVAISPATGSTFTLLPPDNATGNFTKVVQRVPVKIELKNLSETEITSLRAGLSVIVKVNKR